MLQFHRKTVIVASIVLVMIAAIVYVIVANNNSGQAQIRSPQSRLTLDQIPLDGERAYQMLHRLCELGPRYSGSTGMLKQQEMLKSHFEQQGATVTMQPFRIRHPETGEAVEMANLVAQWNPERTKRLLLCAHYDTRPYPDRDPNPQLRRGVFVGANDGASGTALLAELAYHIPKIDSPYGIDIVLFDGEEFIFDDRRDTYFLGSEYFARQYAQNPPAHRYEWGVLLDMVGDAQLEIYQEKYSMSWPKTRLLVQRIWKTADRLGVKEFIPRRRYEIRDDHLPLNTTAHIPTCDIIDFGYPQDSSFDRGKSYWHTTQDTPDKCSALSLAKVGWVVLEWLRTEK